MKILDRRKGGERRYLEVGEKWKKEDDIHVEKQEHSPSTSKRTRNPGGFYSENWDDEQNRKWMNGKYQTNSSGFLRWCFATES